RGRLVLVGELLHELAEGVERHRARVRLGAGALALARGAIEVVQRLLQTGDLAHLDPRPRRGERLAGAGLALELGERSGGPAQERAHDPQAQDEDEGGDAVADEARLLDEAIRARNRRLADVAQ